MRCVLGARPRDPGYLQNICVDLLTLTIGNLLMIVAPRTINDAHGCRMLMIFMKRE